MHDAPQARGRAELHFHLLPGVDDGPATMDEALEMAEMAIADGTTTVVATPHVRDVDVDEIPERVEELERRLRERRIPLEVRCGAEVAHDDLAQLSSAQLHALAQGPPGARWVLLEAPLPHTGARADDLHAATSAVREQGLAVLLAHPERSPAVLGDDMRGVRSELAAGSMPQVNATSLTGAHGEAVRLRAFALLERWPLAVVASDAHRPARGPALSAATRALVEGGVPPAEAAAMTGERPRRLLERGLRARDARAQPLPR